MKSHVQWVRFRWSIALAARYLGDASKTRQHVESTIFSVETAERSVYRDPARASVVTMDLGDGFQVALALYSVVPSHTAGGGAAAVSGAIHESWDYQLKNATRDHPISRNIQAVLQPDMEPSWEMIENAPSRDATGAEYYYEFRSLLEVLDLPTSHPQDLIVSLPVESFDRKLQWHARPVILGPDDPVFQP